MQALELKVPPIAVFLIAVIANYGLLALCNTCDLLSLEPLRYSAAALFAFTGIALGLTAVLMFRNNQTTVHPTQPHKASSLVTQGIFKYTRNPMYLALLLLLVAHTLWLGTALALLTAFAFVAYLNRFQIAVEERALRAKFGQTYLDYCQATRRWL